MNFFIVLAVFVVAVSSTVPDPTANPASPWGVWGGIGGGGGPPALSSNPWIPPWISQSPWFAPWQPQAPPQASWQSQGPGQAPWLPPWLSQAPWFQQSGRCTMIGATCLDCNTKLVCTRFGGVNKPCSDSALPHCNLGECSATPSSECPAPDEA